VLQKIGARLAAEAIFRMCLDGSAHRRVPRGIQEDNAPEVSGTNRCPLKVCIQEMNASSLITLLAVG
jgi:hypothetical protein